MPGVIVPAAAAISGIVGVTMGSRITPTLRGETIDPHCIPDTFVEGIDSIEETDGGYIRYTLYATRAGQRIVVTRLVYPRAVALKINRASRTFLDGLPLTGDVPDEGIVPN